MKFLPGVFMDAMRDNPEAAVHIFEGTHENPELIWNDNSREKVSTTVREMMLEYVTVVVNNGCTFVVNFVVKRSRTVKPTIRFSLESSGIVVQGLF